MDFFGFIEAFAMVVLIFYVVICIVDVIYDAIHAYRLEKAQRRNRSNDLSEMQS